jgi:hypothetical protein
MLLHLSVGELVDRIKKPHALVGTDRGTDESECEENAQQYFR